jgi:hypothetical protein
MGVAPSLDQFPAGASGTSYLIGRLSVGKPRTLFRKRGYEAVSTLLEGVRNGS